jgi:hypothetical protein
MPKPLPKCRNCGKKSKDNLSMRYCSVECREAYAEKLQRLKEINRDDTGSYYDNFVDGEGW